MLKSFAMRGAFLLLSVVILGCGEVQSPRDAEVLRRREQIHQRWEELKPLVGEYEGTFFDVHAQQNFPFRLNIVQSGKPYDSNIAPDEILAPTLSASVYYYRSESYIIFSFSSSDYDAQNQLLTFYSDDPKGSLNVKIISSNHLQGDWTVSSKGLLGNFDVVKKP